LLNIIGLLDKPTSGDYLWSGESVLRLSSGRLASFRNERIAIARALVNNPTLLLADELTDNVDESAKQGILAVFSALKRQGRTIVMVTHDVDPARIADR